MDKCRLCPRECGVDRINKMGFCGMGDKIVVARCAPHMWEEPPISGTNGSGAIFFSGCNLKCVYCQNYKISEGFGKEISAERLADIILELQEKGVHNINFVTPTPYADKIIKVLDKIKHKLFVPVVYNCGGYESEQAINMLDGYIDIYLPDFKYFSESASTKYSGAHDYFKIAKKAIDLMIKQVKAPVLDENGIMKSGVIIRHMVIPGLYKDSIEILKYLDRTYDKDMFYLSLMSQFTPNERCKDIKELSRRITSFEYKKVADFAAEKGFKGFFQERSSAKKEYTPDFDLTGV